MGHQQRDRRVTEKVAADASQDEFLQPRMSEQAKDGEISAASLNLSANDITRVGADVGVNDDVHISAAVSVQLRLEHCVQLAPGDF